MPVLLLTGFGLGWMRPGPGTWGSLPPILLAFALTCALPGPQHWMISVILLLFGAIFTIACIRFGDQVEAQFGDKDPGAVVADELAGQSIALLFLPWREPDEVGANLLLAVVAFLCFRVMDITKPYPAHGLQRLKAGWGIVLDDLVAGVYALVVVQALSRAAWPLMAGSLS